MLKDDGVMPSESGGKTSFQTRILDPDKLSFKCARRINTLSERKRFIKLSLMHSFSGSYQRMCLSETNNELRK